MWISSSNQCQALSTLQNWLCLTCWEFLCFMVGFLIHRYLPVTTQMLISFWIKRLHKNAFVIDDWLMPVYIKCTINFWYFMAFCVYFKLLWVCPQYWWLICLLKYMVCIIILLIERIYISYHNSSHRENYDMR